LHCIVHVGDRDSEVWKRYSRFSELAPGALSVGYNVSRVMYAW